MMVNLAIRLSCGVDLCSALWYLHWSGLPVPAGWLANFLDFLCGNQKFLADLKKWCHLK